MITVPSLKSHAIRASKTLNAFTVGLACAIFVIAPLADAAHSANRVTGQFSNALPMTALTPPPDLRVVNNLVKVKAVIAKDHPRPQRKPTPPHKLTINELAAR